ncbi:MAG: secretin N-terminal domain-containing protein [Myxococcota bacterium]
MRGRASLQPTACAPHRKGEGRGVKSALALGAALLWLALGAAAGSLEIYVPRSRPAEELAPLVQALLAGHGSAVADPHSGKLVLSGEPEAIAQALAALKELDQPVRQYRVDSETSTRKALEGASARVDGWIEAGDVRIGRVVGPEGVRLHAAAGGGGSSERLAATLVVMEGRTAEIWTGADVPFTTRTIERVGPYSRVTESTELVQVRSGFRVRPRSVGPDQIEVEITPIVEELGRGGTIRETGASTQIRVSPGESVAIGGVTREESSAAADLFQGAGRSAGSSDSLMLVRVTPLDDAPPATRGR